jgi:RimJ/RimL family protein N-acetyltransferase
LALIFEPLTTPRLSLEPITQAQVRAIIAGDLSSVTAAAGWPQEGTPAGLDMALRGGHAPGWFVTLDGAVIGDCGIHGEPDASGTVEIGFGLAEPFRGQGYGTELVAAVATWLQAQPAVTLVVGRTEPDNIASRRVMERAGFTTDGAGDEYLTYRLGTSANA